MNADVVAVSDLTGPVLTDDFQLATPAMNTARHDSSLAFRTSVCNRDSTPSSAEMRVRRSACPVYLYTSVHV